MADETNGEQKPSGGNDEKVLGDNSGVYIPQEDDDSFEVPVDFGGFIVSLGTSCMVNLGRVENPETGRTERDLESAKHTIEILRMLKQKTKGNLVAEEQKLLDSLLYDVRKAYVAEKEGGD